MESQLLHLIDAPLHAGLASMSPGGLLTLVSTPCLQLRVFRLCMWLLGRNTARHGSKQPSVVKTQCSCGDLLRSASVDRCDVTYIPAKDALHLRQPRENIMPYHHTTFWAVLLIDMLFRACTVSCAVAVQPTLPFLCICWAPSRCGCSLYMVCPLLLPAAPLIDACSLNSRRADRFASMSCIIACMHLCSCQHHV